MKKELPVPIDKPPMKDSLLAQLTAIERLLKSAQLQLYVNLRHEGTDFKVTLTPNLTRVALMQRAAELRKEIGARIGTDSFKTFMNKAMEP